MEFVIINGKVISKEKAETSSFLSNDVCVFTHKVWFGYGSIPLLTENINLLKLQTESLGAQLPELFAKPRELLRRCKRMLNKNKFYRSGTLNFTFFITGATIDFTITAQNRAVLDFPIVEKGLLINIARHQVLSSAEKGYLPVYHQSIWKTCQAELQKSVYQSSVLLNEKGFVTEAIGSNLFVIKNKVLFTPSSSSGCYCDIFRPVIIELAEKMQLKLMESDELTTEALRRADEIFLISEAKGLQWVLGIENKRFVRDLSLQFYELINSLLEVKAH